MLTQAERQAMRERCDKATAGPWLYITSVTHPDGWMNEATGVFDLVDGEFGWFILSKSETSDVLEGFPVLYGDAEKGASRPDANEINFIIHARTDQPKLLDALDEADALLAAKDVEIARLRGLAIAYMQAWSQESHNAGHFAILEMLDEYARRKAEIEGT